MFEALNAESNLISITDRYKNHNLRRSGVLYKSDFASGGIWDAYVAKLPITGLNNPIVIIRPRGIQSSAFPCYSVQQQCIMIVSWWNYTIAEGIEYYIFDEWIPPVVNYGLELKNSANQITYHSNWMRLKVLDKYSVGQWGIGGHADVALTNRGKRLGIMMVNPRVHSLVTSSETMAVLQESCAFTSDLVLRIGAVQLINSDGWWAMGTGWWNNQPLTFFTVDIDRLPLGVNYG